MVSSLFLAETGLVLLEVYGTSLFRSEVIGDDVSCSRSVSVERAEPETGADLFEEVIKFAAGMA